MISQGENLQKRRRFAYLKKLLAQYFCDRWNRQYYAGIINELYLVLGVIIGDLSTSAAMVYRRLRHLRPDYTELQAEFQHTPWYCKLSVITVCFCNNNDRRLPIILTPSLQFLHNTVYFTLTDGRILSSLWIVFLNGLSSRDLNYIQIT